MRLIPDQQALLDGAEGTIVQRLMRLLVRLGTVFGAERMVEIASAQVSGVSYKSIGDPGLAFLEDLAVGGARVRVPTTLNPAGMDLRAWRELGFPEDFAAGQQRIIAAFEAMGALPTVTCTPYQAGHRPRRGQHLAWAESSAVSFANSVIGARTNREGGPSALAAAVCGCTPEHGLHRDEHRRPTVRVAVEVALRGSADFGALGYHVGRQVERGVPYFTGLESPTEDDLKGLGAAMAASGAVALYHVEGVTPEADPEEARALEVLRFGRGDLQATYRRLDNGGEPDVVMMGCPHASLEEVTQVAAQVEGRRLSKPLWVCTSRAVLESATRMGLTRIIEEAGGRLVADTCMVVAPIERMGFGTTAVPSGKAAAYLPGFCGQRVVFRRIEELLEEVAG